MYSQTTTEDTHTPNAHMLIKTKCLNVYTTPSFRPYHTQPYLTIPYHAHHKTPYHKALKNIQLKPDPKRYAHSDIYDNFLFQPLQQWISVYYMANVCLYVWESVWCYIYHATISLTNNTFLQSHLENNNNKKGKQVWNSTAKKRIIYI